MKTIRAEQNGMGYIDVYYSHVVSKEQLPMRKMVDGQWIPQYRLSLTDGSVCFVDCKEFDVWSRYHVKRKMLLDQKSGVHRT